MKPMSNNHATKYNNNKTNNDTEENINLAYRLARQDEEMEKANKTWWANLKTLK